jgi:hypothetical protein
MKMEAVGSPEMFLMINESIQWHVLEDSNFRRHCSMNLKSETAVWNTLYPLFFFLCLSHIQLRSLFNIQSTVYKTNQYLYFMFMDGKQNELWSYFFWHSVFSCLWDFISFLYSKHMTWLQKGRPRTEGPKQNIWTYGSGSWRKLQSEEVHNLCTLKIIITMSKWRMMIWSHVACTVRREMHRKIW